MTEKLSKPKKVTKKPYYEFYDVMHYLEQLHGKNFRNYAGKTWGDGSKETDKLPYLDFWHWFIEGQDQICNGCFVMMPEWEYVNEDTSVEPWIKEILGYFKDFLGEDYDEELWLWW